MSELFVDLKAPNGHEYKQPLGLFINNEFVKSSDGEKITSINPTYLPPLPPFLTPKQADFDPAMRKRSPPYMLPPNMMLMSP